jgi:hypothetical protein
LLHSESGAVEISVSPEVSLPLAIPIVIEFGEARLAQEVRLPWHALVGIGYPLGGRKITQTALVFRSLAGDAEILWKISCQVGIIVRVMHSKIREHHQVFAIALVDE